MVEITASECVLGSIFVCSFKRIKTRHNIVWRYQDKMRNVVYTIYSSYWPGAWNASGTPMFLILP